MECLQVTWTTDLRRTYEYSSSTLKIEAKWPSEIMIISSYVGRFVNAWRNVWIVEIWWDILLAKHGKSFHLPHYTLNCY